MLDATLLALLVTLIVQGMKAIGLPVSDTRAKVVTIAVGALFFLANGLIDLFVPAEFRLFAQQVIDFLKALLVVLTPAGIYGYIKLLKR